MENILWDDVVFKLRKTRQKLALSLTPLGAVRAAAEGSGYKNRRLGKSRGVRFDSGLLLSVRCDTLWAWNGCSVFLLALLSVSGNTHAVSLLHASLWVQLLWRQRRILSPLSPSPLPRVSIKKKKVSVVARQPGSSSKRTFANPFKFLWTLRSTDWKWTAVDCDRRRGITAAEGHGASKLTGWPRQRCTKSPRLRQLAE